MQTEAGEKNDLSSKSNDFGSPRMMTNGRLAGYDWNLKKQRKFRQWCRTNTWIGLTAFSVLISLLSLFFLLTINQNLFLLFADLSENLFLLEGRCLFCRQRILVKAVRFLVNLYSISTLVYSTYNGHTDHLLRPFALFSSRFFPKHFKLFKLH